MILDVSQLIQNDGAVKKLDFTYKMEDTSFNGQDIVFEAPFKLEGTVKNIAGVLYLELSADVSFRTQCARCLEDVRVHHLFDVSEVFSKTRHEEIDEEITLIDSGNIDLGEAVEKAFIGSIPINYLCSDDCKGLCSVCGTNLNLEACSCDDDNIDPRLAVLKQFLKD